MKRKAIITLSFIWLLASSPLLAVNETHLKSMDSETIRNILESTSKKIRNHYVFEKIGNETADNLVVQFTEGAFAEKDAASFAKAVSAYLTKKSNDKHMQLYWTDPTGKSKKHRARKTAEEINFGISKIELMDNNVRYLDLREFVSLEKSEPYIEAAMKLLSTGSAIIFDLRNNGGGDPATVNLIFSYFMKPGIEYISFYNRNGNKLESLRTQKNLKGDRLLEIPVYVLISNRTFSGGEELAYNFKSYQRGLLLVIT